MEEKEEGREGMTKRGEDWRAGEVKGVERKRTYERSPSFKFPLHH